MSKAIRIVPLSLVPVLILLASTLRLDAQDRIFVIQGTAANGVVQEIAKDKVVMQVRGNNQNFPTNTITWVVFEGEPAIFPRAKEFAYKGQYDEAMAELKKIDASSLKSDNSKKDLDFYRAYTEGKLALMGKGDAKKAAEALLAFVQANRDSFHFYDCSELLGELALHLGVYDKAALYFGALSKAPFKELSIKSRYLEARALLAQNKFAEAKKSCGLAMAESAADAAALRIQKLAAVLAARCDAGEGNSEAALTSLRKLIQDNDATDTELFSKIYNAQGEALYKLNRMEEAAIAFLHTDLLFASQSDSHAEALYYLIQIWPKIGEPQRAVESREKLNNSYPGTSWAKK